MTFFSHSGMPRNQRFQNTKFQHILEPMSLPVSGMAHIFAFQNIRQQCIKEHQSFLKYHHLGILEPLLIGHSGMAKKGTFQNEKRSANYIFQPFWNVQKSKVPEHEISAHSGTHVIAYFWNVKYRPLTEPKSFLKHQHSGVMEPSIFTLFGAAVLKHNLYGAFWNKDKIAIPDPLTAYTFRNALKIGFAERSFCQMFLNE